MKHLISRVAIAIRDWWRGWSDKDLFRAIVKVEFHGEAGEVVAFTQREMRAYMAYTKNGWTLRDVDAGALRRNE